MTGAVSDKGDLVGVAPAGFGAQIIKDRAERFDQLKVGALILAADVVTAAQLALVHHQQQRVGVVFDKQPVADVRPVAVDRQRLSSERVEDDDRDQFLGEMEWPVVVAAIGQHHRQAVGFMPGPHQMVRAGFRCRIRAARIIGRVFGELDRRIVW